MYLSCHTPCTCGGNAEVCTTKAQESPGMSTSEGLASPRNRAGPALGMLWEGLLTWGLAKLALMAAACTGASPKGHVSDFRDTPQTEQCPISALPLLQRWVLIQLGDGSLGAELLICKAAQVAGSYPATGAPCQPHADHSRSGW